MTSLFRKHNAPKRLHTRWGDVAISTPTDGAWNQYNNPHNTYTYTYICGPGFVPVPEHSSAPTPRTQQQQPSFSRRLSMRLVPRSMIKFRAHGADASTCASSTPRTPDINDADADADADENENENENDSQPLLARRSHFAYRPIQQDYPREIESAGTPRDALPGRSSARSSCGSSTLASSEEGSRRFSLGVGPDAEEGGWRVGARLRRGSGSAGKRRFSARRMTMVMVPDAEDIYG